MFSYSPVFDDEWKTKIYVIGHPCNHYIIFILKLYYHFSDYFLFETYTNMGINQITKINFYPLTLVIKIVN